MEYILLNCKSDYDALSSVASVDKLIDKAIQNGYKGIGVNGGSSFKGAITFYKKAIAKGIKPVISLEKKINEIKFLLIPKNFKAYCFLINEKNGEKILLNDDVVKIAFPINEDQMNFLSDFNVFYGLNHNHVRQNDLYQNFKNLKRVVAPKVLYIEKEDRGLYKAALAIKRKKRLREIYIRRDYHFFSSKEIQEIYGQYQDGIENVSKIFSQIDMTFDKVDNYTFKNDKELLRKAVEEKLTNFKENKEALDRAKLELKVIEEKNLSSYFLLVKDIVSIAEDNDILVGPGRGSAASSFVSYLLGITKVNPLKYDLLFERFLNKERESLPDIDLDIEHSKRELLLQKVAKKYPSLLQLSVYNKFTKKLSYTILSQITSNEGEIEELSEQMDSLIYNRGLHPAGVLISNSSAIDHKNSICEYDMHEVDFLGIIKIDLLSLRTLTLLKSCLKSISKTMDDIPLDDKKTFEALSKGFSDNIFQLESDSAKDILKKVEPKNIEDLAIVLALNRPGPLESGLLKGNFKKEDLKFIYQENLMIELNKLGYGMDKSANLIRAISKKDTKTIEKIKKEMPKDNLGKTLDKFGSYCFPKSHAISYALISYFIGYIKTNYPDDFEVALVDNGYKKSTNAIMPDINFSEINSKIIEKKIVYGLDRVKGLDRNTIYSIVSERKKGGIFSSIQNLKIRTGMKDDYVKILRSNGALSSIKTQMSRLFGEDSPKYTICLKIDNLTKEDNVTLKNLIISNPGSIPVKVVNRDKSFILTKKVSFNEKFVSETQKVLGFDKVYIKP